MNEIRPLLESLCVAFNARDLDLIMAHFAEDCVLEMPRGPEPWGGAVGGQGGGAEAALAGRFEGLPDVHYGDASHFVDGATGISKWTLTVTTSDGRRVEVRGCDFVYLPGRAGGDEGQLLEDRGLGWVERDCPPGRARQPGGEP